VIQSTTAAAGSPQSWTFNNLTLETTYYYRVWALDEWNNPGPNAGTLASTTPYHPAPQPPAVTAGVAAGEVLLTWTAPATPPAAYLDHYEIDVSGQDGHELFPHGLAAGNDLLLPDVDGGHGGHGVVDDHGAGLYAGQPGARGGE
jgi:hypothetical protein